MAIKNIIVSLNNSAMVDSHWDEVREIYTSRTGKQGKFLTKKRDGPKTATVKRLQTHKMGLFVEEIMEISSKATKEKILKKNLDAIINFMKNESLIFKER